MTCFMFSDGILDFLDLAEKPITIFDELSDSTNDEYISAFSRMSIHPTALALAMSDGNSLGETNFRFFNPIVFIALAVEPIFPG